MQQQYEKEYVLGNGRQAIEITKGEILQILNVKKLHHKKLLLSLLIHSKRYAGADGTFFMAYSVMTKMGNTDNRTRLLKYLHELQDIGVIEIVSHGKMDEARSRAEGQVLYKTNEYKVTLEEAVTEEEKTSITLKLGDSTDIYDIVPRLVSVQEAKKILPRRQMDSFKEAFKKVI